ncbi:putative amidase [Sesamum angolense]|uniref:Amidase n=1 Tax=Sesamum angolense TaxID=2727404 RepID=A0AAE1WY35_9LAMI|nr:putative amidase [Sesamum angolense]
MWRPCQHFCMKKPASFFPFLSFPEQSEVHGTRFTNNPGAKIPYSKSYKQANMEGLDFTIEEASIEEIQQAFGEGRLTARQLVDFYLHQIETLNPVLRGVIEVNPDAQQLADESDREKERSKMGGRLVELGELHGIPVLLKDTIGTNDKLNTTAGSYALLGSKVSRDAGVVERLRMAGAIILGKASLSEWYKFRSLSGVPNGWCARAGQGVNPYVPSGTPCGSSSGSAISVAANMVLVALGTETHSSIICPSDHNSVVGLKPTVGLTSRAGVIPMTPRWDTVGPIGRTVADAVCVLDVIAGLDPRDEATMEGAKFIPEGGYKQFLNENGLKGKRLGIVRHPFVEKIHDTAELAAFETHIDTCRKRAAEVVDNLKIDNVETILEPNHSGEVSIMMAEFKAAINTILKRAGRFSRAYTDILFLMANCIGLSLISSYSYLKLNLVIDSYIANFRNESSVEDNSRASPAREKTDALGENIRRATREVSEIFRAWVREINERRMKKTQYVIPHRVHVLADFCNWRLIQHKLSQPAMRLTDAVLESVFGREISGREPKVIEISYAFEKATNKGSPPLLLLGGSIGGRKRFGFVVLNSMFTVA